MKFILLLSGAISERFIIDERFKYVIESDLVGMITSQRAFEMFDTQYHKLKQIPKHIISEKIINEKQLFELIKATKPDYVLSIQYPWVLSFELINKINGKILNLHNAKLPDYRGHNCISYEILNEETIHTSTLHWIEEEVDRGKVVKTKDIKIEINDTAYSLWSRSIESALTMLAEWFESLSGQSVLPVGIPVIGRGHYYKKNID